MVKITNSYSNWREKKENLFDFEYGMVVHAKQTGLHILETADI